MKTLEFVDLTGKVAVVTGGNRGIGAAIAGRFLRAGARVAIVHSSTERPAVSRPLQVPPSALLDLPEVDVRSQSQVKRAVSQVLEHFDDLHVLVNNAGVYPHSLPTETSEAEWDRVLDTNLKGAFLFSQEAAKSMLRLKHGGKIVNMSSIDAWVPERDFAHYDASKTGLLGLTRSLALSWGEHGINVNAVAPGLVDAPGLGRAVPKRVRLYKRFAPLSKLVTADDVANVVLFLCSDLSSKITGQVICVDSGVLLSGYMSA